MRGWRNKIKKTAADHSHHLGGLHPDRRETSVCSILCRHQHPVCLTPHNDSEMVKADEKQMIVQRFLGKQTATAF